MKTIIRLEYDTKTKDTIFKCYTDLANYEKHKSFKRKLKSAFINSVQTLANEYVPKTTNITSNAISGDSQNTTKSAQKSGKQSGENAVQSSVRSVAKTGKKK